MNLDDLLDDPKSLLRYRVLRSTRPLLAERGLSVSMDDIAQAAGVSRRSLFRHFESRNALIADALASSMEILDDELHDALSAEGDLREWLTALTRRVFSIQSGAGVVAWQLASTADDELPSEFAAVNQQRRVNRRKLTELVAHTAWRRAGGRTPCPRVVVDSVALAISSFATRSLVDDYNISVDRAVDTAVAVVASVINDQLAHPTTNRRRTKTSNAR